MFPDFGSPTIDPLSLEARERLILHSSPVMLTSRCCRSQVNVILAGKPLSEKRDAFSERAIERCPFHPSLHPADYSYQRIIMPKLATTPAMRP